MKISKKWFHGKMATWCTVRVFLCNFHNVCSVLCFVSQFFRQITLSKNKTESEFCKSRQIKSILNSKWKGEYKMLVISKSIKISDVDYLKIEKDVQILINGVGMDMKITHEKEGCLTLVLDGPVQNVSIISNIRMNTHENYVQTMIESFDAFEVGDNTKKIFRSAFPIEKPIRFLHLFFLLSEE